MAPRNRQSGEGKLGCFLWLLAFALAAWAAYKYIPVKIADAQLVDYMSQQAQWAGRASADQVKKGIFERAKELDLPLREEDIRVEKHRDRITMEIRYTVPIDLGFYVHEWTFHHQMVRDIFIV